MMLTRKLRILTTSMLEKEEIIRNLKNLGHFTPKCSCQGEGIIRYKDIGYRNLTLHNLQYMKLNQMTLRIYLVRVNRQPILKQCRIWKQNLLR
ncbi:unnamed protein product [Callosobruchus maculatus]|uniref:Uncharacterized protein n=1 Tax=Callosobruchus maculatus TaxID=64391 RepID=A0A653CZA0_CALMS|nr:unnamed protein product [Callosobruchus maculatus]